MELLEVRAIAVIAVQYAERQLVDYAKPTRTGETSRPRVHYGAAA